MLEPLFVVYDHRHRCEMRDEDIRWMVRNELEFSRLDGTDDLDWLVDSAGGLHLVDCTGESIEPHELEPGRFEIRWSRTLCPPPKP